jgi:VWFA-related protein
LKPGEPAPTQPVRGTSVEVTGTDERLFPRIAVQFEVRKPDGSFLRDAIRDNFRVSEDGHEVEILEFEAPREVKEVASTVVLVVDRSGSMAEEDRMGGLKRAVRSFLNRLPAGSRIAVVAFGSEVEVICPFTEDRNRARQAIDELEAYGATRFYDAVAAALALLESEPGTRRAVLALTDGQDTHSRQTDLPSVSLAAKRLGLPVYTLGLGTEEMIASNDLRLLAESTRGQYYPAREADQLKAVYEQIAERLRSSYALTYQSDRRIPDGTLRPIRIVYEGGQGQAAAETAVFIPGMVVPAGGWSFLFLGLVAILAILGRCSARLTKPALLVPTPASDPSASGS